MSTKSKNIKPRYYTGGTNNGMLYAVYADTCYYYTATGWRESGPNLVEYISKSDDYSPCNLRDVAAAFPGVIPHKRISNNTLAGTNPA